jgi:imidazoleglycerol phosphate dehydratase HisB
MKPLDNTTTRVRFDESVRFDVNVRPDETRIRVPVMSSTCVRHFFEREVVWWIHIHETSQTWTDIR